MFPRVVKSKSDQCDSIFRLDFIAVLFTSAACLLFDLNQCLDPLTVFCETRILRVCCDEFTEFLLVIRRVFVCVFLRFVLILSFVFFATG